MPVISNQDYERQQMTRMAFQELILDTMNQRISGLPGIKFLQSSSIEVQNVNMQIIYTLRISMLEEMAAQLDEMIADHEALRRHALKRAGGQNEDASANEFKFKVPGQWIEEEIVEEGQAEVSDKQEAESGGSVIKLGGHLFQGMRKLFPF